MVTTIAERHALALESVKDFTAQAWPHKELVIVNATGLAFPATEGVYELPARSPASHLWEFGVEQCKGEWIADWQDDCRYSPRYLHVLARRRSKERRVSLLTLQGICVSDGSVVNVDNDGTSFSLTFRLGKSNGAPIWLDKRELVTRFYASRALA